MEFMPDWTRRIDREQREIASAHQGFLATLDRLSKEAAKGLLRANAATRTSVFRNVDKELRSTLHPLRSRYDDLPSRSGRTSCLEACHVALMPDTVFNGRPGLVRLTAVRLALLPNEIEVELVPLGACLRPHSAERVLERADEMPENAMRHVGLHMLEWLMVPFLVDDTLDRMGLSRLSVPGDDNEMILGYMDRSCPLPVGELYKIRGGRPIRIELPVSPYAPGVYVVNTFLGWRELKPTQLAVHDAMARWREDCGPSYWTRLEDGVWQTRVVRPPVSRSADLPDGMADAIRDLCSEEQSIYAMQAVRPPSAHGRDEDGFQSFDEIEREYYHGPESSMSPAFR
jgi:hypothetical protein